MEAIAASAVLTAFWERLRVSPAPVMLLDYDGTLAPLTPDRDHAWPYPGVADALARLRAAGHTRLVLVTGREPASLVRLLGPAADMEVWGCHGLVRRLPSGREETVAIGPAAQQGLAQALAALQALVPAAQLEQKPSCLAVHWRGLPEAEATRVSMLARQTWAGYGSGDGLQLHDFDGGLELRSTLASKARAVETVLAEVGPAAAIACLGDDLTDEAAFAALPADGLAVQVRPAWRTPTTAQLHLRPPGELLAFLDDWGAIAAGRESPQRLEASR